MTLKLSNKKKAGLRFIFGFNGTSLNDDLKYIIKELQCSGIILFSRNIENPEQLRKMCFDAQNYAKKCGNYPLFIAIDQEGGIVARLKEPEFKVLKGLPFLKTTSDVKKETLICADELNKLGINFNMVPVLDINSGSDSIMKDRSFSSNPNKVAELGAKMIKYFTKNGIFTSAKHFPGIGRTTLDSHFHLPIVDVDIDELHKVELVPFKEAIKSDVPFIMLSHIIYNKLDKYPASLSKKIAKKLLRENLGYNGIVITDDLDMKALDEFSMSTIIKNIIEADIDIILICHKGKRTEAFYETLKYIEKDEKYYLDSIRRINKKKRDLCT